ncbi:FAD-dependent oxidoreductase [Actinomycetospora sp. TBRC 11914]|uniref:FAD-dependent oxidoreductase n=1 Tax=Actinomycetospora sp. TBRC 11914 TaxID=2729387 RepID=UPI00145F4054|nr:FAD-dependent oxidoreductase [Actinomycetospora sp. TBRC 11914]NMO92093.1 NAD(P)/FAD-dependent oxidoreductase [Actinomycetospora sp. TBRC 11914]
MDIREQHPDLAEWNALIERCLADPDPEPITNLDPGDERPYDAVFVGGGAGGRFGAAYLRAMGGRPLIVDAWPFLGGSCPHQACVPHHLFSEAAAELDRMRWFSDELYFPKFDPSRAGIKDLVDLFVAGRSSAHAFMNWQTKEQLDVEYVLNARASLVDPTTVRVAGRTFRARNLVLGTGARPVVPDVPGIRRPGVHDFISLVESLDAEPARCVVIGGSKVAMEYGSFFHATGCPTTMVSRSPVMRSSSLHHVDEDLRRYVVDGMRRRGMEILEGAEPVTVEGVGADGPVTGVTVRLADGSTRRLEADMVFLGLGERPDTTEARAVLGIEVDDRGRVVTDRRMRTSVPGVYAIGDMIAGAMEMWKARKSGVTAARNIMGEELEFDVSEYPDFLHTTYEVSWVGLTEQEARDTRDDVVVIQMPPYVEGLDTEHLPLPCAEGSMLYAFRRPELSGFQKLVVDGTTRQVLGAHHCGYGAKDAFQYLDHLIHRPEGLTIDELGWMNELFLNPEHFVQLSRLRAGKGRLTHL